MIQPPVMALEEAQRGSFWLEDLVAILMTCPSWEHLSCPVYLRTLHAGRFLLILKPCHLLTPNDLRRRRSDDSLCFNIFLLLHLYRLCLFFFFLLLLFSLSSWFLSLRSRRIAFLSTLWCPSLVLFHDNPHPPLLPLSPHLPFTPHSASPQAACTLSTPPLGTSQNSPVTPYVLVPCLHFPPSSSLSPQYLSHLPYTGHCA